MEQIIDQLEFDCIDLKEIAQKLYTEICHHQDDHASMMKDIQRYVEMRLMMDRIYAKVFKVVCYLDRDNSHNKKLDKVLTQVSEAFKQVTKTNFKCAVFTDKIQHDLLSLW